MTDNHDNTIIVSFPNRSTDRSNDGTTLVDHTDHAHPELALQIVVPTPRQYTLPLSAKDAWHIALALNALLDSASQFVLVALIGETGDTDNISAIRSFILKEQARLGVFTPNDVLGWRQHLANHLMDLTAQGG